jgi:pimeloyl-ACP methyl ester carboxylesterase
MTAEAPANLTAYDRLHWSATELETLLATGQHRRELLAYFGHADYERLAGLARHAAARPRRGTQPRVYVIPGILGSELGVVRPEPWPADLIWVDAIDIIDGRLTELGLAAGTRIVPLGVLPPTYAPLQLELRAGGCDVVMHAYDWRRSVLETGRELAARLDADPAPEIHIIAHSMGGLVARAALRAAANARVVRLITVATPHAGSFAPLQALRGTYPVVRRLAALDRRHDAGQLAGEVFRGFPSLYEMLPTAAAGCGIDLFDAANWPRGEPAPDVALLHAARALPAGLAPVDERCIAIVGVGQRTVTGLRRAGDEFVYAVSGDGDGTVPALGATLPGAQCYFFRSEHSDLPRSPTIARALMDLVRKGTTAALRRKSALSYQAPVHVSDAELRGTCNDKVDWHALAPEARRVYLQQLNVPPPQYLRRARQRDA